MAEIREVESIISSPTDKHYAYRNMFNYVFDPDSPTKLPAGNNNPVQVDTAPEIKKFQAVFRKLFRSNPFPNLSAACEDAKAEFEKAVAARASTAPYKYWSAQQLKVFDTQLRSQMELQKKWIKEADSRRRDKFQSSAKEDAIDHFKGQLSEKYPFDCDSRKFYEESDLRKFLEELETKAVAEFEREINQKFEAKSELPKWVTALRQEISKIVSEAIKKNKENYWARETEPAVNRFKSMMAEFLGNHQFLKQSTRDSFCSTAKSKCEEEYGLSQFLTEPLMKSVWDAKVEEEYRHVESVWMHGGDLKIESFMTSVKAHGRTAFTEHFGLKLKDDVLERMFSQVASNARMELEEGEKSIAEDEASRDDGGESVNNMSVRENNHHGERSGKKLSESTPTAIMLASESGNKVIIPENTRLPTEWFSHSESTTADNETSTALDIYEVVTRGVNPRSRKLGQIRWTGIPPAKKGVEKLDCSMKMDENGVLTVEWEVVGSGIKQTDKFKTSLCSKANGGDGEGRLSGGNARFMGGKRIRDMMGSKKDHHGGGGAENRKKAKLHETNNNNSSN